MSFCLRASLLLRRLALPALLLWVGGLGAMPLQNLRFQHLGVEQGLPQESVLSTAQDAQGFIWMGTQNGLVRYDGYRFVVYRHDPGNPRSLNNNLVQALLVDAAGTLWIATHGGLHSYDAQRNDFERHLPQSGLRGPAGLELRNLIDDGAWGLWLGSSDGLQHFDKKTSSFRFWHHDPDRSDSLASDRVRGLALDQQGRLWVGTAAGLDRLDPAASGFAHLHMDSAARPDAIHNTLQTLMVDRENRLWIGTYAGLERWELNGPEPTRLRFTPEQGISRGRYYALLQDRDEQVWVGAISDGLKRWSPQRQRFVQHRHQQDDPHSLSDDQLASLFQDRTGTLWVGTWDAGINLVDLSSGGFERVLPPLAPQQSKIERVVNGLIGDGRGGLWVAGLGGLKHLDLATDTFTDRGQRLSDKRVHAMLRDEASGRLLLGTETGLELFEPATGHIRARRVQARNATSNNVLCLLKDRSGALWVGSAGGLHRLASFDALEASFIHQPADPKSISHDNVQTLLEDREGRLWVGTNGGLNLFDAATGRFRRFHHSPGDRESLAGDNITALLQDRLGRLWIGTDKGLSELKRAPDGSLRFRSYGHAQGLVSERIMAIVEDLSGVLWLSTDNGLMRFFPQTESFRHYTAREGMVEGSYSANAGLQDSDGRIYFGGVRGITRFHPDHVRANDKPPQLALTELRVFNQRVQLGQLPKGLVLEQPINRAQELTLSYRHSVFTLEFAALHFADVARNRYAYMLQGFDSEWVEVGAGQRAATYTNLNPGRYVFHLRAANKDGLWTQEDATLTITITPPLWQTWWARLSALLLMVGGLAAAYRLRMRSVRRQTELLEQQVQARTAEALQQAHGVQQAHLNISVLSEIGREITANLVTQDIAATLHKHVTKLMDATVFGFGIYKPERQAIDYDFCVEGTRRFAPYSRPLSDPDQLAVCCLTQRREIWIRDVETDYPSYITKPHVSGLARHGIRLEDGSEPGLQRSMLYLPVVAHDRVLGVISVHSLEPDAYDEVHLNMLRTLAAYAAVALENAQAFMQLQSAQTQLVAQEKLAALGAMVAGVAHELNTPIGNSLLVASTLHEHTTTLMGQLQAGSMKRSDLNTYCEMAEHAAAIIMRSLHSAAELVSSFKQVAVDQTSAQQRRFDLLRTCNELLSTLMSKINKSGHQISVEVPEGIMMNSYPGPLGQVLANLVNNAMLHGFEGREQGHMWLRASQPRAGRVLIEFEDDGLGIAAEHQKRVFEPFFTTKFGQGGSGLGMHISYNIVTSLLGGQIELDSAPGRGTRFTLDLPLDLEAEAAQPGQTTISPAAP
ncbi:sensor histidine kinase [Roseateles toxinivorans]|uniref:histidine kinase n=1 Tax=Roseateles toxinivorans TaxID=270368 RepID=A0A4R6QKQ8_9BURK|nr:two-component regulator propeller domain-containing protein [Roseateles toxinivorans]TDP63812.1 ligand-binding sensor domain-containing protein [Roseateles toxinivorans]